MGQFQTPSKEEFDALPTLKKKMLFLLKDTVKYYSEDVSRRAYNAGSCKYRMGKKACAIGRYVTRDKARFLDNCGNSGVVRVFDYLPAILRQFDKDFLASVQNLHDTSTFWNDKGLSDNGKIKYDDIKKTWKLR